MYVPQQRNMYSAAGFGYGNYPGYTIPAPEPTMQTSQSCYYNSPRHTFNNYARTPPQSFPNSCSYSLPSVPNPRPPPQNCNVNIYNEPHQTNFPTRQSEALIHIPRHPARDLQTDLEDKAVSPISEGKPANASSLYSHLNSLLSLPLLLRLYCDFQTVNNHDRNRKLLKLQSGNFHV